MIPRLNSEHTERVSAPTKFLSQLGNLHDAKIQLAEWSSAHQEFAFLIDDLYGNFVGLPEYPGPQPVRLAVGGVRRLEAEVTGDGLPLRIIDFEVEESSTTLEVQVTVKCTSGRIRIEGDFIACRPHANVIGH